MNFSGFDFDEKTVKTLNTLESQGSMPHSVVLEGENRDLLLSAAVFLSMYAVCAKEDKPCGVCPHCLKAKNKAHADISYPQPENKKSKTYSVEQMREIIKDAYILPNEAKAKVYVFEDADLRLSAIVQNAFLKLMEEPPQNVYFILLCESSRLLLPTVLSRCALLKIGSERKPDEICAKCAEDIARGMVAPREYELLKALKALTNKDKSDETLMLVKLVLRDTLAVMNGAEAEYNAELAERLSARLTTKQVLELMELTDDARQKLTRNININLLTTRLCGEYRRIIWQR